MELFNDQIKAVSDIEKSMTAGNKRVLLRAETGSGKTIMATNILHRARQKKNTTWFVVPRKQLLRQTANTYEAFGLPHSYIASGKEYDMFADNYIVSLQTLTKRLDSVDPPRLAIVDECHFDFGLDNLFEWFKKHGTYVIGLSATPLLSNGDGLDKWFGDMVMGLPLRQLIDLRRLSDYRYFEANAPDKAALKANNKSDYTKKSMTDWLDVHGKYIVGNAIDLYKEYSYGKLCIHFAPSIQESERTAMQYNKAGIPAAHMDGNTPELIRNEIIRKYAEKELLVLCNVDLMTFGFDLSAQVGKDVVVETEIDASPTKSLTKQRQKWGRALRRKDEPATIIDLVGNSEMHNYPCTDIDWNLDGKERKVRKETKREVKMRQCPSCPRCHPPAPKCPYCGHEYEVQARKVENVDGIIREIDKEAIRATKKVKRMEVGRAKTIKDLQQIAKERGYKQGWVYQIMKARGIKR